MRLLPAMILLIGVPQVAAQLHAPPKPRPISLTETAVRLAADGAAHHTARTVMAAAEILRMAERGSARVERVGPAPGPRGAWEGELNSTALLRLASSIAADQGDWATADYAAWLLQLPDSIPVTRGAAGGPLWADSYLGAGAEANYTIEFEGGQNPNMLQVAAGKTGSVLQCALYEAPGSEHPAIRGKSLAGTCSIRWTQETRGKMTLRIRNAGPPTYFVMSSN